MGVLPTVFSNQSAASNGTAQFNLNTLTYGTHDITVSVTDTTGLNAEAIAQVTVNGLPSQPTVTILPDPAYGMDDLTASPTGSTDPEGVTVTYTYDWHINGASSGNTAAVLLSSETQQGETWTVYATPSDGSATGLAGSASTINNTAPTVSSVIITLSSNVYNDDTLCVLRP